MWRDPTKSSRCPGHAHHRRDLQELGCIDGIVPEPRVAAHVDHEPPPPLLDSAVERQLAELKRSTVKVLVATRYAKFRKMAQFFTGDD
jgi:acetyl-CoA carboxylase carboxyl transferase subunit alpha